MKRFWIGICVLALLAAAGLWGIGWMQRSCKPICRQLEQASQASLTGHWEQAAACFGQARAQWERWRDLAAAFTDHSLLEAAEGLLAQLQIYAKTRDAAAFAAGCAQLSQLVYTIADSHLPTWQNLL